MIRIGLHGDHDPSQLKLVHVTLGHDWVGVDLPHSSQPDGVVAAAHDGSSLPACSATMYAAYQSGQFASRWPPVRFSCSPCAASARRSAAARSSPDEKEIVPLSTRPGKRSVISCSSQLLPSGSLNDARDE